MTTGSSDPKVVLVSPSSTFFHIDPVIIGDTHDLILDAVKRYQKLTFPHPVPNKNNKKKILLPSSSSFQERRQEQQQQEEEHFINRNANLRKGIEKRVILSGVHISVRNHDDSSYPQLDTDESYSLHIDCTTSSPEEHQNERSSSSCIGSMTSSTYIGTFRALETFSQLVSYDFDTHSYHLLLLNNHKISLPVIIKDQPRFRHRGLMIDTARHYLPLPLLLRTLDAMSYSKLNVLHWHISDTQSFPLEIPSRPRLARFGAFSWTERYLMEEAKEVVEYGRRRGIRVVPEFDVPGHAASWCAGYPQVCPNVTFVDDKKEKKKCLQPLNVASEETFRLLDDIISDCTNHDHDDDDDDDDDVVFHDDFFHLGGDEVNPKCWTLDPQIQSWLHQHNMTTSQAYGYFVGRAASIVRSHNRRPVQWSEVYNNFKSTLHPSTIVHVWTSNTNMTSVGRDGYDMLVNVADWTNMSWYIDHLASTWDGLYRRDPCGTMMEDEDGESLCLNKVLGGQAEMWGETVDGSDLEATVWPRAAAIAERLWSPLHKTNGQQGGGGEGDWHILPLAVEEALPRLEAFRCLLNERGVGAAPVNNSLARSAPPGPGSCYQQRMRMRL